MKKILLLLFLATSMISFGKSITINRIDPTDWFVGMKNPSLQLMVYGEDLGDVSVTTDYAGVTVDSIVHLQNSKYLLAYLHLQDVKPGVMKLKFTKGKSVQQVDYVLKAREMKGEEHKGFSNADVLYMLMPDRFADGSQKNNQIEGMNAYVYDRTNPNLRHGGDLEGIRQHLDYFNQLGVTALWFTPVLENNSPDRDGYSTYHGYATTDFYRVDPRFGTNSEYRQLAKEAHAKGLKIVMDMIFNHTGFEHAWIQNVPSDDWFNSADYKNNYQQTSYKLTPVLDPYASKVDLKETVDGWFVPTMPDLNQKNPHVLTYLIQNSKWWIETVGLDGIRMDTYPYADRKAMADWLKDVDEEYPNFNVVGETWVTEPAYTATWQKDSKLSKINSYLKTVMDFSFFDKMSQAKNEDTDGWWQGYNRIYNSLVYDYLYENPSNVMAFLDNHDTDRFLGNGNNVNALKQALAILLTVNRIPQLYYGTEVLMNGTKAKCDGDVRKDFTGGFPGDTRNAFTKEGRTTEENMMFDWMSSLLHWRQGNDIIIKGSQTQFTPYKGIYVIARQNNGKSVLTILNGISKDATMEVKRYAEIIGNTQSGKDVITGKQYDLQQDIKLSPKQTLILEF